MRITFYCDEIRGYTLFQVAGQWGVKRGDFEYTAPNGITICSGEYPKIEANTVWIRGVDADRDERLIMTKDLNKQQIIEAFKSLVKFQDPQKGDIVKVRQNWGDRWEDRIFLTTIEDAVTPYVVVKEGSEKAYKNESIFFIDLWAYMEPKNNTYKYSENEYEIEWE